MVRDWAEVATLRSTEVFQLGFKEGLLFFQMVFIAYLIT